MASMPLPTRCSLSIAVLLSTLLLIACGGRSLNKNAARNLIANSPITNFDKEDVYVESITQISPSEALVETRLKAALRLEKVRGEWIIREVRLGDRPWEKLDDVLTALKAVQTEETRKMLETIATAVGQYRLKNGSLPTFRDYVTLSDKLYPDYLAQLIRNDAWNRPLAAQLVGMNTIRLTSAGPDGKFDTPDDIELTRSFPP